jgi:NTE family protein
VRARELGPEHALASGAIPLLFRPVRIDGSWFTDGGVRQNTPLAPAIRLGADRMLVVGLRAQRKPPIPREDGDEAPTTAAQLGKVLNALMLDRTDYDLERMRRLNAVIAEGERVFGPGFGERLASMSAGEGAPIRRVSDVVVRPSVDLAVLAREHAERRIRHVRHGTLAARLLRRAASDAALESDGAADLASYLLFDREYAADLMALGYQDAAARRDALVEFFQAPAEVGARSA